MPLPVRPPEGALATTTGEVTVRLYKGQTSVASRRSPYSLYDSALGGFDMEGYRPADAEGFINLLGLPLTVRATLLGPSVPLRSAPASASGVVVEPAGKLQVLNLRSAPARSRGERPKSGELRSVPVTSAGRSGR